MTLQPSGTERLAMNSEDRYLDLRESAHHVVWKGPERFKEDGIRAVRTCFGVSAVEITAIPDFGRPDLKYLDPENLQVRFLAALHTLGQKASFSCALRYYRHSGGIRAFLIVKCAHPALMECEKFIEWLTADFVALFPEELYRYGRVYAESEWDFLKDYSWVASGEEVIKAEELVPGLGADSYYFPMLFECKGSSTFRNTMLPICEAMMRLRERCMLEIVIEPATFNAVECEAITGVMQYLEKKSKNAAFEIPAPMAGGTRKIELGRDSEAEAALKAWRKIRESMWDSPLFLYSIRIFYESPVPRGIAEVLASSAIPPGGNNAIVGALRGSIELSHAVTASAELTCSPLSRNISIWDSGRAPSTLRRIHRLASLEEIKNFFKLPIPTGTDCPGFRRDTGLMEHVSQQLEKTISLGHEVHRGSKTDQEICFDLTRHLAKHALIVGVPGSGKTNLCFSILHQLWANFRIPFIVIEPAKTEYRALKTLPAFANDLLIFTPGNENISPFRLNPFSIMPGVKVSTHISRLKTCFEGAFTLYDPCPMILDKALNEVYYRLGWSTMDIGGTVDAPFPSMDLLLEEVTREIEGSSYRGELKGNIEGSLKVRINSLCLGEKGMMLNCGTGLPFHKLMKKPVIFELDSLNEEEKALMTLLIINSVQESVRSTRKSGECLTHVILVEEAHNIIGSSSKQEGQANPKEKVVRMFSNMLAEFRAMGEGIVIADQLPTALAPEAVKHTNVKVMHRLTPADDRSFMGKMMSITKEQEAQVANLNPGESLVFMEGWDRPRYIVEQNFKERCGVAETIGDLEINRLMKSYEEAAPEAFMPFASCSWICNRCDRRVLELSRRWAMQEVMTVIESLNSFERGDKTEMTFCELFIKNFLARYPERNSPVKLLCFYNCLLNLAPQVRTRCGEKYPHCVCRRPEKLFATVNKVIDLLGEGR